MSMVNMRWYCLLVTLALICHACSTKPSSNNHQVNNKPSYPSGQNLTSEQRKIITNSFLKQLDVPVDNGLPLVEDYSNAHFRRDIDVARRCIILSNLIYVAHHERSSDDAIAYLKKYHLWSDVSPSEIKYLENKNRPKQEDNNMSWQVERLNVLFWSLGIFDELPLPLSECDFSNYKNMPDLDQDPLNWIENARLRRKEDILNETDLIYRIDWATTDARLNNRPMPYHFNNDIVHERHFALNWVVMYEDNWDDITTDT